MKTTAALWLRTGTWPFDLCPEALDRLNAWVQRVEKAGPEVRKSLLTATDGLTCE
jgi:hypothetical protein